MSGNSIPGRGRFNDNCWRNRVARVVVRITDDTCVHERQTVLTPVCLDCDSLRVFIKHLQEVFPSLLSSSSKHTERQLRLSSFLKILPPVLKRLRVTWLPTKVLRYPVMSGRRGFQPPLQIVSIQHPYFGELVFVSTFCQPFVLIAPASRRRENENTATDISVRGPLSIILRRLFWTFSLVPNSKTSDPLGRTDAVPSD